MPFFRNGRRFSFNIFNDLPGALSSSSDSTPELSLYQKDAAYVYQTSGNQEPWLLTPKIFAMAQILDSESQSKKTYEQLVKMSLISEDGALNMAPADQPGFGKSIMSKCAFIPQIKIKMVVQFLFWWADEEQRLRKLCDEKHTLTTLVAAGDVARQSEVELLLQQVGMRLAARPSQRDDVLEHALASGTPLAHGANDLPSYESSAA